MPKIRLLDLANFAALSPAKQFFNGLLGPEDFHVEGTGSDSLEFASKGLFWELPLEDPNCLLTDLFSFPIDEMLLRAAKTEIDPVPAPTSLALRVDSHSPSPSSRNMKPLTIANSQKRVMHAHRKDTTLYTEFAKIQDVAGIHLPCNDSRPHDCTPACHRYGFHDERRVFATFNAVSMTREALQVLMRHRSPLTTERCINMAQQLDPAVANLHVPEILRSDRA